MKLLPNILPKTCNRIYNIIIKINSYFFKYKKILINKSYKISIIVKCNKFDN